LGNIIKWPPQQWEVILHSDWFVLRWCFGWGRGILQHQSCRLISSRFLGRQRRVRGWIGSRDHRDPSRCRRSTSREPMWLRWDLNLQLVSIGRERDYYESGYTYHDFKWVVIKLNNYKDSEYLFSNWIIFQPISFLAW